MVGVRLLIGGHPKLVAIGIVGRRCFRASYVHVAYIAVDRNRTGTIAFRSETGNPKLVALEIVRDGRKLSPLRAGPEQMARLGSTADPRGGASSFCRPVVASHPKPFALGTVRP